MIFKGAVLTDGSFLFSKMKGAIMKYVIITILLMILCIIINYAIATSDLPFWFKFWLLR